MKKNIIRFLALCFVVLSFTLLAGCSCNIGSLRVGFEYELNEDRRGYTLKDYHYLDFVEESVKIPKRYKGKLVKAIANGAFSGHKGLTGITIPNSVEYIGNYAFSGCEELEFVEIPNSVVYIGEEAFSNCTNLKEVKLPNNLTTIDKATFSNCSSLKTINIPSSVTRIKEYAFDKCSEITNLSIPDSVVEICLNAFEPNLSRFNRYTTSYGVKYYGTKKQPIYGCFLHTWWRRRYNNSRGLFVYRFFFHLVK